jgi:hypothetical protein
MVLANGTHLRRDGQPFQLFVETGWAVSDVKTRSECELAQEVLVRAIAEIEQNLERARSRSGVNPDWFRRAASALRLKRVALREVAKLRDQLEPTNECGA